MTQPNLENFLIVNPWRTGNMASLQKGYHSRWLFDRVLRWLDTEDILVIHGPRQVGKTTLLYMFIKYLLDSKGVSPTDVFYFNIEDPLLQTDFFSNYLDLYRFVKQKSKGRVYIFCDEAQKIPNIGVFLKNLYDLRDPQIKIIITGSSTLELKQKLHEPLTGRKKVFHLYPLSFKEYLEFRTGKNDWISGHENPDVFNEFITYGGYPKVALAQDDLQKKAELHEIYTSYLQKDIKDFLRIENPDAFNRLLRILADQIGNLLNIQELSNTLSINRVTLEKYLKILEETFVIHRLPPFYTNPRKEITKMPKIYFLDSGLRNYISGNMTIFPERPDIGKVSENHVFTEYYKSLQDLQRLYFWRTQNKTEIDFIYFYNDKEFFPIEVKYGASPHSIPPGLRNFIENYKPAEAVIFSRQGDDNGPQKVNSTSVLHLRLRYCGVENVAASLALPFHKPLS